MVKEVQEEAAGISPAETPRSQVANLDNKKQRDTFQLLWVITGNGEEVMMQTQCLPANYPCVCYCCNCMCHSGCRSNRSCCTAATQPASPSLPPLLEQLPLWAYLHRLSANITEAHLILYETKYNKT